MHAESFVVDGVVVIGGRRDRFLVVESCSRVVMMRGGGYLPPTA